MKVGVLGSGNVGQTLASGFLAHGHEVMVGTRSPEKLEEWQRKNPKGGVGAFVDAAKFGELIVLAVRGKVAATVLRLVGDGNLAGKIVIDVTNPIKDDPPTHGVLKYFTNLDKSLMEGLQSEFKDSYFVKAFNSVGSASMVNPQYEGGPPTMCICGNDDVAKRRVTEILEQFGWDVVDMGMVEAARAIEPLAILWCIPGFLRNEWVHAFKLLR